MRTAYVVMLPKKWTEVQAGGVPIHAGPSDAFLPLFYDRERAIECADGREEHVQRMTVQPISDVIADALNEAAS